MNTTESTPTATNETRLESSYSIAQQILETARLRSGYLREASLARHRFADHLKAGAYATMNRLAAESMDMRIARLGRKLDTLLENRTVRADLLPASRGRKAKSSLNIDVDWLDRLGRDLLEEPVEPKASA